MACRRCGTSAWRRINYNLSGVSFNQAHIVGARNIANDGIGEGLSDGLLTTPGSLGPTQTSSLANDTAMLGDYNGFPPYSGMMSELLLYKRDLSNLEIQKVNSYLAIKYGITLDSTVDYITSDSIIIYPSTSTHSSYINDIAGIGRDDASVLDQRK